MRFRELWLEAHGPFTDDTIDLSGGRHGLHVLVGDNASGKTSACEAIADLLFGIPMRTRRNFVHPYGDMRVGARVELASGQVLDLVRVKKRQASLLDRSGRPVSPQVLDPALRGLDRERYLREVSLDHAALVAGAEEILAGRGDVGTTIFAASLATAQARKLLVDLEAEAATVLSERRDRHQRLRRALEVLRAARSAARDAGLSSRALSAARDAVARAQARVDQLASGERDARARLARAERLRRALPRLLRRRQLLDEIARQLAAGPAPALPPGFEEEWAEARRAHQSARETLDQVRADLARIDEESSALVPAPALLEQGAAIEALQDAVAVVRADAARRATLLSRLEAVEEALRRHAADLAPGEGPEALLARAPSPGLSARLDDLAEEGVRLLAAREAAVTREADARRKLSEVEERLAGLSEPADATELRDAVAAARRLGDADRTLGEERAHLEADRRSLERQHARTPGLPPLDALETWPLPDVELVESFRARFAALETARATLEERRRALREELRAVERTLAEQALACQVPSEDDLVRARRERGERWTEVLDAWASGVALAGERERVRGYEALVETADALADRLRREADRVATRAQALARRTSLEGDLRELERQEAERAASYTALERDWKAAWSESGVAPRPPADMAGWLDQATKLAERVADLRRRRELFDAKVAEHTAAIARLTGALRDLGVTTPTPEALAAVLARAVEHLEQRDELEREGARLRDELTRRREASEAAALARSRAEAAVVDWQERWAAACREAGLPPHATLGEARRTVAAFEALRAASREAEVARREVEELDARRAAFEQGVHQIVRRVDGPLEGEAPESAVATLVARLRDARRDAARRDDLHERRATLLEREAEAAHRLATADAALARLCEAAGVASPDELPASVARARVVQDLRRELAVVESALAPDAPGGSLEALEAELGGSLDPDRLEVERSDASAALEALEAERQEAAQALGASRRELEQAEAAQGAGTALQAVRDAEAEVARLGARWLALQAARSLLARRIEAYRERHEGPILRRAGELFARFSLGTFTSLGTVDAKNGPVVVAHPVAGGPRTIDTLSDGEREQLYLSLRLAAIERSLDTAEPGTEPLPLVVDDVLLRTDERRAAAVLHALADLSSRVQVLFFTHRAAVAEQARALGRPGEVFVVRLGESTRAASAAVSAAGGRTD